MKVGIPKERRAGETRVAATPETVKKLKGLGLDIVVEAGASGVILSHDTKEGTMNAASTQMQALPTELAPITRIRKEELA